MTPQEWLETAEVIGEWLADALVDRYPDALEENTSAFLHWACSAFSGEMMKDGRPYPEIERAQNALAEVFERHLLELNRVIQRSGGSA
jgi:hypothetical protein